MSSKLSRRGFLKLAPILPLAANRLAATKSRPNGAKGDPNTPNVLILVFDALSALDISLYGFHRETMPNLARFAEHATVYHNHYAAGNYTTPGTASILTGTYPWTHRAFSHHATVLDSFILRNVFSEFGQKEYTRIGFSHNLMVNILLHHLGEHLDEFVLPNEIALVDFNFSDDLFKKDFIISSQGERRFLKKPGEASNSLFLSSLLWSIKTLVTRLHKSRLQRVFPRGIPGYHDMLYPLEDTIDWIIEQLHAWPQPFLSYLHLMPPHDPYSPRQDFVNIFWDGWEPVSKPDHFFSEDDNPQYLLNERRVYYNEYIAYADAEFGRLHDHLEANGLFDNTIVVFTSDHGEIFERRIWKHTTPTLYQPLIRVPLLLSLPGQTSRHDVHSSTSCVDILPTLLHLTGQRVPDWCEGQVLPPYGELPPDSERSLFVVEAKSNPKMQPLRKATVALIKGGYKLVHYFGYNGFDGIFELYNLKNDPEELQDLYETQPSIVSELTSELLAKIEEKNTPFMRTGDG
ncbi:MAG: sulfatase-like hydrolase/transferase [Anaerolineales bacterium]|nr:sulfatase-like hydrolase/transferase [Anaerolineales bacterium]